MKVTIIRKVFLEGLEMVKESVGRQAALPILQNIKLTAKDGTLNLYTTNLSIGTILSLRDVSIISEGEALCDAQKLMAIVKELPEREVKIEIEERGHLMIKCGKSHFRLLTIPPEDFPSKPQIPEDELFPIDEGFFDSLRKVKYAVSKDERRYLLNGVFLGSDIVATDGHRMGIIRKNLGFDKILIPLEFVNLVLKTRNREGGICFKGGCFKNTIFIKAGGLLFFGRLIDGEFPNYSQVIPNDSPRKALIEKLRLYQAVKRIMLMSGKDYQMRFEFNPCSLILSSFSPDLGDALEEIEIEYRSEMDGDKPFAIALNGRYLLDILELLEDEKLILQMGNEVSPLKVEENDSIHIIMPLYLPEPETQPVTESETEDGNEQEPESGFVEEEETK
jgi:DNA polymerase-3 subunit beta